MRRAGLMYRAYRELRCSHRAGVRVHLHGTGYAVEGLQKSTAFFRCRVVTIYRSFLDRVGITNTVSYRVQFEITKQWNLKYSPGIRNRAKGID